MTSDIKDIATALVWLIERIGHADDCSAKPNSEGERGYSCNCGMNKAQSAVQHGTNYGDYGH